MTDAPHGQVDSSAAEIYDEFFVPALFGQWTEQMLDAAEVSGGHAVLDVGCGTGALARAAAHRVGDSRSVVGLDVNPGMLTVATHHDDQIAWRLGEAENLPFDDDVFDSVLSQFALMFFRDRALAVREAARVLASDGRAVFATWASADRSPGYAAMIDLIESLFGTDEANALRAPFVLGEVADLDAALVPSFENVAIDERPGEARFDSIEAWVHTDIRGWTLSGMIDEKGYRRLLAAAQDEFDRFTDPEGRVRFAAPALVAVADTPLTPV